MFENQLLNRQIEVALEVIKPLLQDDTITDIYIDDFDNIRFKRYDCNLYSSDFRFESRDHLKTAADLLFRQRGLELSAGNPFLDTVTSGGQRVNIVVSPIYDKPVCITIRKFPEKTFRGEDLIRFQTIDQQGLDLLKILVQLGKRILIAGETGSGKTTLLNVCCSFIDESIGRVITIEDARELQIPHPYLISLQTSYLDREFLSEDHRNRMFNDILINSLRMDPSWTILGEIRGREALTLVESFISHPGMATIHAKSCRAALIKLKMKIGESHNIPTDIIDQMIVSAVDVVIFMKQLTDRTKKVMNISEVAADSESGSPYRLNPLYEFDTQDNTGAFKITGRPSFMAEITKNGLDIPTVWR